MSRQSKLDNMMHDFFSRVCDEFHLETGHITPMQLHTLDVFKEDVVIEYIKQNEGLKSHLDTHYAVLEDEDGDGLR